MSLSVIDINEVQALAAGVDITPRGRQAIDSLLASYGQLTQLVIKLEQDLDVAIEQRDEARAEADHEHALAEGVK
jgi:hypothetical protein